LWFAEYFKTGKGNFFKILKVFLCDKERKTNRFLPKKETVRFIQVN